MSNIRIILMSDGETIGSLSGAASNLTSGFHTFMHEYLEKVTKTVAEGEGYEVRITKAKVR